MNNKVSKKDICIDFDGVLNTYRGWAGEDELYEPLPGCQDFLKQMSINYKVNIFTTRNIAQVEKWLEKYELRQYVNKITDKKVPAVFYIDDRAIKFNGNFQDIINQTKNFKTYWQK